MPIVYTDPDKDVPPGVDFLVEEEVRAWVAACEVDKPWRIPMRLGFTELVGGLPAGAEVLEIGSGPGLLAECILERCPNLASYTLLDFSEHMLRRSRERLAGFPLARFVRANFKAKDWTVPLEPPYSAVLAMQAVHEIRHKRHWPGLYRDLLALLAPGGSLLVCEGQPGDASLIATSLYMTPDEQVAAMHEAGFSEVAIDRMSGRTVLVHGRAPS